LAAVVMFVKIGVGAQIRIERLFPGELQAAFGTPRLFQTAKVVAATNAFQVVGNDNGIPVALHEARNRGSIRHLKP
jgi:hypothetical protein